MFLVFLGDRFQLQMREVALGQEIPGQVVLMQALLDGDDGAVLLVIKTREQSLLIEVMHVPALGLRARVIGLQHVVNDEDVGAMSHGPAVRNRFTIA
jgi:hypothetical protein